MTKEREALKMALAALEEAHYKIEHKQDATKRGQAITAIEEALAQPSDSIEQEPVAWLRDPKHYPEPDLTLPHVTWERERLNIIPLYTTPPAREWVGLTDEEVDLMSAKFFPQDLLAFHSGMYMAQNILKEKNNE